MKRTMIIIACAAVALCAVSAVLYSRTGLTLWMSLGITFFTISYHFLMRFAVGGAVDALLHDRVDYTRRWFAQKPFEPKLYKALGVKKWKNNMPTYSPDSFSMEKHTLEEIVQAMCQSEIVHEIILLLSFVPIAFIALWGQPLVFILTSVAAACVDGMFVIMQRYNRPRLLRLMKHQKGVDAYAS